MDAILPKADPELWLLQEIKGANPYCGLLCFSEATTRVIDTFRIKDEGITLVGAS
jgi:hypothetical protein